MRSPRRPLCVWALCLTLVLALGGCVSGAPTRSDARATSTATPSTPTPTTTHRGAFVCANPAGSHATYAYTDSNHLMYLGGCSAPVLVSAPTGRQYTPIAFSSDGAFLLVWDNDTDSQSTSPTYSCLSLITTATLAATSTRLCNPEPVGGPSWAQWYTAIAWASADSFYLAVTAPNSSVEVKRVAVPSLAQTHIASLTWVATMAAAAAPSGIVLRNGSLYYGGYMSTSEGGAWLHRLDLATGVDTRLVRLGLAGTGGCMVADVPCGWTGPWDVDAAGDRITYHSPGPTHDITDTYIEPGQPMYVSAPNGSNKQQVFPSAPLNQGFNELILSPDGDYVVAPSGNDLLIERLSDGTVTTAPQRAVWPSWTPQPDVMVTVDLADNLRPELYNVVTGARTPLQAGTSNYVWV